MPRPSRQLLAWYELLVHVSPPCHGMSRPWCACCAEARPTALALLGSVACRVQRPVLDHASCPALSVVASSVQHVRDIRRGGSRLTNLKRLPSPVRQPFLQPSQSRPPVSLPPPALPSSQSYATMP